MNKDFNRWEFIEKWLPNYSWHGQTTCQSILPENTTIKIRMTETESMQ